jgi:acyl carrier protein
MTTLPAAFAEVVRPHCRRLDPAAELPPDTPLFELGVDSLAILSIIIDVEARFGITLPEEAMTAETFATAASLWSVVDATLTAAATGASPAGGH